MRAMTPVHVAGVQVFDGEVSLLELLMIPVEEDETAAYTVRNLPEDFDIPHAQAVRGRRILRPHPAVCLPPAHSGPAHHPRKITVHLGRPLGQCCRT